MMHLLHELPLGYFLLGFVGSFILMFGAKALGTLLGDSPKRDRLNS